MRNPNTNRHGGSFDEATIEAVWRKATPIPGYPGWARDICGAMISRQLHGKTVQYGWEVDHIIPVAAGGTDDLSNFQPLQWENNRIKGDSLTWTCKVRH